MRDFRSVESVLEESVGEWNAWNPENNTQPRLIVFEYIYELTPLSYLAFVNLFDFFHAYVHIDHFAGRRTHVYRLAHIVLTQFLHLVLSLTPLTCELGCLLCIILFLSRLVWHWTEMRVATGTMMSIEEWHTLWCIHLWWGVKQPCKVLGNCSNQI